MCVCVCVCVCVRVREAFLDTGAHDDLVFIAIEEEECVMAKISKRQNHTCSTEALSSTCRNWLLGIWNTKLIRQSLPAWNGCCPSLTRRLKSDSPRGRNQQKTYEDNENRWVLT